MSDFLITFRFLAYPLWRESADSGIRKTNKVRQENYGGKQMVRQQYTGRYMSNEGRLRLVLALLSRQKS